MSYYNTPRISSVHTEGSRCSEQVKNHTNPSRIRRPNLGRRNKDPLQYDPSTLREDLIREFFLYIKTERNWKPKSMRSSAAYGRFFERGRVGIWRRSVPLRCLQNRFPIDIMKLPERDAPPPYVKSPPFAFKKSAVSAAHG